ncbi:hypothetical protein IHE49_13495 [Rhodanobacter sp. 7MK24]|uniref:bestrophin family protein n=1 Tax=Rhodanobacter sp. 7MK24 TaxID=2775922 RepID=UPI00177ABFA0|nr:bestrophin family ion channel [Rhodanobacter sp. 7MK24]MBD8881496.1 hypothetical protein [Rhodanobacter sp. 7MK24]
MIIRPRPNWFRMLFVLRGSVLPDIAPQLIGVTLLAAVITVVHGQVLSWKIPLNVIPFSLIGMALAIFLGFRNSTSYARWWEARTLWGTVLNAGRSLVRMGLTLARDGSEPEVLGRRTIAFVHALRHQLRNSDPRADLERVLDPADAARAAAGSYKPAVLLLMADEWVGRNLREGRIDAACVPAFEQSLGHLTDALGGCERIAATPIPFTYSVIIHRTIYLYCILLPFGLVDQIGVMTPLIVAFISYTFFALEALGSEIEEPFGFDANDLALDAMSRMIERTLREMLGEPLPAEPVPGKAVAHLST